MFTQSNYVRLLSGWGVVGLAVVSMLVVIGGFALHEALWRRVVGVSAPRVVQFPRLGSPPAISHAIPPNDLVHLFQFALLCHLCFGIACDIVEPACAHGGLCGVLHLESARSG